MTTPPFGITFNDVSLKYKGFGEYKLIVDNVEYSADSHQNTPCNLKYTISFEYADGTKAHKVVQKMIKGKSNFEQTSKSKFSLPLDSKIPTKYTAYVEFYCGYEQYSFKTVNREIESPFTGCSSIFNCCCCKT